MVKRQSTNIFTLCGQEDDLAKVGSHSPTLFDARAIKDALYNSEENETELKWEAEFQAPVH